MDIFNFDPANFLSFLLTLMRFSIVLFLLPFFGGQSIPTPVKASLLLVLTLALWPALSFPAAHMPATAPEIALMLIGEVTLGMILGLSVKFLFAAVQFGGMIMGFQMGFSMVNIMDPLTGESEVITSHFMYMITLLTFLCLNGHLHMLKAMTESFALIPPGGLYITPELGTKMLTLSSQLFVLAIKVAAPVMVAVLLVDMALAVVAKVAPQMHLLVMGFPIKIAVGFLFMGMIFTLLSRYVGAFINQMTNAFHTIMILGSTAQ